MGTQMAEVSPTSTIPAPLHGMAWMVASCLGFALLTVLIRHVSADLHPFEIVFFRNFFGLLAMLPWVWRVGISGLRTRRLGAYGVRAVTGLIAMLCWFTAISLMPLAEATALSFTAPLFATLGAALFLGETVRLRRWTATIAGFAGAMIILRPGIEAISPAALLALAASAFMAVSVLTIKSLSRTESPNAIVLYMGLMITPLSLPPALMVWTMPALETWGWLAALGGLATLGHLALVRAFAAAEVSAVLPLDFSRLIFIALLAFVFFGERPDAWTWTGAAVIFAAVLYTAHRESRLGRPAGALRGGTFRA